MSKKSLSLHYERMFGHRRILIQMSLMEITTPLFRDSESRYVWVARNPPGFAFVEFEDPRDAQDACRYLDGSRIGNGRIRVEMSRGGSGGRGGRDRRRRSPAYSPRRSPRYSPRRSPVRRYSRCSSTCFNRGYHSINYPACLLYLAHRVLFCSLRSRSRSYDRYRRSRDRSRSP